MTVQAYVEVIKELYSLKSVEERWAILKRCETEDLSLEQWSSLMKNYRSHLLELLSDTEKGFSDLQD